MSITKLQENAIRKIHRVLSEESGATISDAVFNIQKSAKSGDFLTVIHWAKVGLKLKGWDELEIQRSIK